MKHQIGVSRQRRRLSETDSQPIGHSPPMTVDVAQFDVTARDSGSEPGEQASDGSRADHADAVPDVWTAIPETVDGGFEVRGKHGAA